MESATIVPNRNIYRKSDLCLRCTVDSPLMTDLNVVIICDMLVQILKNIIRLIFRQFVDPFGEPNN